MRYGSKWPVYADQWNRMVINPSRVAQFRQEAEYAVARKDRYMQVEGLTGVKWYHIAVIHRREGDGDFNTYLGNGQSLARRTTIVPAGRGPFPSFEAGAVDSLKYDGLSSVSDWRLEKILYFCELFNGAGYDGHGIPSPYLWGGTNIQQRGKYVSDHHMDMSEMDSQPGCAPLLWSIAQLDSGVVFKRETPMPGVPTS